MIRHAEAEGNIHRRAHGQYEGQITTNGFVQIELLKERFKKEKIDAVYSSDLLRARVTATALSEPRGLSINTTKELREVCMGVWEDVAWGDIDYSDPEMSEHFRSDPARWRIPGGEPYFDLVSRMKGFVKEAALKHDGGTIALFSHGFAIRAFFCDLMGYRSDETLKVRHADNTAVALLFFYKGDLTIEYQGDASHLSDETSTFARQRWWRAEKQLISENMRFMTLDEERDFELLDSYRQETWERTKASKEYTAILSDEPVGFVGLADDADYENTGRICHIYLKPEYRRQRYGVQLIGLAISEFRKKKREFLQIEAPRDNPVVKLCRKQGFEVKSESGELLLLEKYIKNW